MTLIRLVTHLDGEVMTRRYPGLRMILTAVTVGVDRASAPRPRDRCSGATEIEGNLKRTLVDLGAYVTSATEAASLRDVFRPRLVDINVEHARSARTQVARWDAIANRVGVATAATLLPLAIWFVWWLHARAVDAQPDVQRVLHRPARDADSGSHASVAICVHPGRVCRDLAEDGFLAALSRARLLELAQRAESRAGPVRERGLVASSLERQT
jgi:hypothetical protein